VESPDIERLSLPNQDDTPDSTTFQAPASEYSSLFLLPNASSFIQESLVVSIIILAQLSSTCGSLPSYRTDNLYRGYLQHHFPVRYVVVPLRPLIEGRHFYLSRRSHRGHHWPQGSVSVWPSMVCIVVIARRYFCRSIQSVCFFLRCLSSDARCCSCSAHAYWLGDPGKYVGPRKTKAFSIFGAAAPNGIVLGALLVHCLRREHGGLGRIRSLPSCA
jgi:hypothetical protein